MEQSLTEIFREVLGRTEVGAEEDFFDLGGSSLMAVRALGRIHDRYGVRVRALDFFESPTVTALARHVVEAAPAERPQVTRRPSDAEPVLSYDQQRLWLEDQLLPGAAYHVHGRQRLLGELDVAALEASLRVIMERHEALRSRFPVQEGRPVQVVEDLPEDWRLRVADLRGRADRDEQARRLMDADASESFSLEHGPLVRCLLVQVDETEHLLSITAHHIVCDDWSVGVFARELAALYAVQGVRRRAGLPALEVQYRDFAVWQRRWLTGEYLTRQVDYWRRHLDGAPPFLALPSRQRPTPEEVPAGGRVQAALSAADTEAFGALCRTADATVFMAVLAGFGTVLSRWSGQDDIVIGVPITGRSDAPVQSLIGFFVNTLPVRLDLGGDPTFGEVLARARAAALGGYAHADAPLDLLVGELPATRVPGRTPLFQVILNGVDTPQAHPLAGITGEPLDAPTRPSKFELTLNTRSWEGTLRLDLEFNANRYEQAMVEQLLAQTVALLRQAASAPDLAVRNHSLSGHPDRPAVVDRDGEWSRDRLEAATEQVARTLLRHLHSGATELPGGSSPRLALEWQPVALGAAAVLGCRRAGVEVTFDPAAEGVVGRLGLSADGSALELLPREGETVLIDPDAPPLADPDLAGSGDDDGGGAWVLGVEPPDRLAVLAGPGGLLVSALRGAEDDARATLVLIDPALAADPGRVVETLHRAGVTVLVTTPPLLRALAGHALPGLRLVVVENTGTLLSHDVAALRAAATGARFRAVHRPGPDGRPAAVHAVPAEWSAETAPVRVPLGTPDRDRLRLVRRDGLDAAIGEVAELRTADGDVAALGRRWADGTLEYVGESGTEPTADPLQTVAALRELPGVRDAVVVASSGDGTHAETIGYVATGKEAFDPAAAQPRLAARLPDALIPRQIVALERLPLTRWGDYDLAALPHPGTDAVADQYVAPRTPLERQIATILAELLGVDRVGVHDSFFELGGFSLLATQLSIRIRETVRVDLALRDIFVSSTVEALASRIAYRQAEQEQGEDVEALLRNLESEARHPA